MTRMLLILLAFGLYASAAAAQAPAGDLTLTFDIGPRTGAVMVALFPSQAAYETSKDGRMQMAPVGAGPVTVTFKGLPPGRYAVKSFHDVNGDGKMNQNLFGMPTEPYGFSNNAMGTAAPPAWSAAAFDVVAGANSQTIALKGEDTP